MDGKGGGDVANPRHALLRNQPQNGFQVVFCTGAELSPRQKASVVKVGSVGAIRRRMADMGMSTTRDFRMLSEPAGQSDPTAAPSQLERSGRIEW